MMKAMDSARRLGANRSDTRRYREDLQRRPRVEDAISCFDISGSQYQRAGAYKPGVLNYPAGQTECRSDHLQTAF